jgi:hypothetical protein
MRHPPHTLPPKRKVTHNIGTRFNRTGVSVRNKISLAITLGFVALTGLGLSVGNGAAQKPAVDASSAFSPAIPKTWDDAAMATLEVPLADPVGSPKHVSADYYYRIPVRPIYRSYPVYAPGHEPPGYVEWLKQQGPEIIWGEDKNGHKHVPPARRHVFQLAVPARKRRQKRKNEPGGEIKVRQQEKSDRVVSISGVSA